MGDTVSRKALIEWLQTEISLENLSSGESKAARWAWKMVISAIESSRFDIPSSESEGEAFWRTQYEQERDLCRGQKDHLREENERLRASIKRRIALQHGWGNPENIQIARELQAVLDDMGASSTSETTVQPPGIKDGREANDR